MDRNGVPVLKILLIGSNKHLKLVYSRVLGEFGVLDNPRASLGVSRARNVKSWDAKLSKASKFSSRALLAGGCGRGGSGGPLLGRLPSFTVEG